MESVLYEFQKLLDFMTKITQTVNIEKNVDMNRIARTILQITSICFNYIAIINLKVLRLDYMLGSPVLCCSLIAVMKNPLMSGKIRK